MLLIRRRDHEHDPAVDPEPAHEVEEPVEQLLVLFGHDVLS